MLPQVREAVNSYRAPGRSLLAHPEFSPPPTCLPMGCDWSDSCSALRVDRDRLGRRLDNLDGRMAAPRLKVKTVKMVSSTCP
jgi:hypothetical protein